MENQGQDIIRMLLESTMLINIVLSMVIIFVQRREPRIVWAWLLVLNLIPVIGFVLYLLIGMDFYKDKLFKSKEIEDEMRRVALRQEALIQKNELPIKNENISQLKDLILYNLEVSDAVLTSDNSVNIYTDGCEKFNKLLEDIKLAQHYVHMEYYIIQKDELWDEISHALVEAASRGVVVRVLFDGMGTRKMGEKKWKYLQGKGIEVGEFFPPLFGKLHLRINYRNHRKIVVIDGRLGFVGGFNIGREYLGRDPKFGYWRDTHLRIEGSAVTTLAVRFALDWNYATGKNLFLDNGLFQIPFYQECGDKCVQIISSGPDSMHQQIRDNYLRLIHKAQKSIHIQTPYFVPDEAILTALKLVAISGIDVSIMIPCKPDHPLVYWATYSYIGELLAVGAKCYVYQQGFLHAKVLTVDGLVTCCGTANMDIRSFQLNFEVNGVIYSQETTEKFDDIFIEDIKQSTRLTWEMYQSRSFKIRFKEGFSRLFSPVL